jgi:hypothetical protein
METRPTAQVSVGARTETRCMYLHKPNAVLKEF